MNPDFEPGDADADHYDRFTPTDTPARRWAALLMADAMPAEQAALLAWLETDKEAQYQRRELIDSLRELHKRIYAPTPTGDDDCPF